MKNIYSAAVVFFLCSVFSNLHADVVGYRDGKITDNVKIRIFKKSVEVQYRDGKKETVTKDRLNYVRIKAVDWTSEGMTEAEKAEAVKQEKNRVDFAKIEGDTWEARHEEDKVSKSKSFYRGLTPGYSGLYKTEHTKTAVFFSALEGILLLNALDFATAKKISRVETEPLLVPVLYTYLQELPGSPFEAMLPFIIVNGADRLQTYSLKGGITGNLILKPQADTGVQKDYHNRLRDNYYGGLGFLLMTDALISMASAAEWNSGTWSGDRGKAPTTAYQRGLRSLIFPGWGQIYGGKTLKGSILAGLGTILLAAQIVQEAKVTGMQKGYGEDAGEVAGIWLTVVPFVVPQMDFSTRWSLAYLNIVDHRQAYVKEANLRDTMLSSLVMFWSMNVLDAMLFGKPKASVVKMRPLIRLAAVNTDGRVKMETVTGIGAVYEF